MTTEQIKQITDLAFMGFVVNFDDNGFVYIRNHNGVVTLKERETIKAHLSLFQNVAFDKYNSQMVIGQGGETMCNKDNLPERVEKAKAAMFFAKVSQYDAEGKVKAVFVPGSNGKQYQVIIRRKAGSMSTELLLIVNNQAVKPTYGAQITYQQMSAVMLSAKEQGYSVTWTANRLDAVKLSNLGGTVFHISNFDNPTNLMWGVLKKEKQ